jgi:hypothetical protein
VKPSIQDPASGMQTEVRCATPSTKPHWLTHPQLPAGWNVAMVSTEATNQSTSWEKQEILLELPCQNRAIESKLQSVRSSYLGSPPFRVEPNPRYTHYLTQRDWGQLSTQNTSLFHHILFIFWSGIILASNCFSKMDKPLLTSWGSSERQQNGRQGENEFCFTSWQLWDGFQECWPPVAHTCNPSY